MCLFKVVSIWKRMKVPKRKLQRRFKYFLGKENKVIDDRTKAIEILKKITTTIQDEMIERIKNDGTYETLLKIYYIFDETHSIYLFEKEFRVKVLKYDNNGNSDIVDILLSNSKIERNIIDASNIWLENCLLLQHDLDIDQLNIKKVFKKDYDLLIDLYLYGMASQGISLLTLSKGADEKNTFYGIDITLDDDMPVKVLKYHPYIFYNPIIAGNQNCLVDIPLTTDSNTTIFGNGFYNEHSVQFLLFLACLYSFQVNKLHNDDKELMIISKEDFIEYVEMCTAPSIDGEAFYNSFVLTKNKIKEHLRGDEKLIWIIGANKYRHELRPFIGLDDNHVIISYGALEQAKQLWVSYSSNGGMCYSNPFNENELKKAMVKRNAELSDILVDKIREILNRHYNPTVDLKDVDYKRIFGEKSINYGDYDIVYYSKESKELYLIESKYFSDSLNSSGMVTDYKKMFDDNGYYIHCRKRYDLVLSEPQKLKSFIGEDDEISLHMLFVSSKPIEMELYDDKVVTFLSLNVFDEYVAKKLINAEDESVISSIYTI